MYTLQIELDDIKENELIICSIFDEHHNKILSNVTIEEAESFILKNNHKWTN